MIVNYTEQGWQIISQRAHGLLAGQLCFNLHPQFRNPHWMETIVATIEHDDVFGEFETDEVLLNAGGGPLNYKMRDFEKDKCDQLIRMALNKSRFIALLISSHVRFLYEKSDDTTVRTYCAKLKKQEAFWRRAIGVSARDLAAAYTLLQWCDACSLLLCQDEIPPENRKIEISTGPGQRPCYLHSSAESVVHIDPWPFDTNRFEISLEYRVMADLVYKSEKEFREKLMKMPPETTIFQFVKK